MTLTQILNRENKTAESKAEALTAITAIITKARAAYGNTDVEVATPGSVNTCDGHMDMQYLTDGDKLALASNEIRKIRTKAIEITTCTTGAVLDKEIERLLAVNPILNSLQATSGSEYI